MKFSFLPRALGLLLCLASGARLAAQTTSLSAATAVASSNLTTGAALTPFVPVTASGGTGPYSFAVAPALPAGLAFDPGSGTVSGTPDGAVLTPPFIGYDGFNTSDLSKWAYSFQFTPNSPGALTVANGRLEFTKGADAGSFVRGWDGDPTSAASRTAASYNQSWISDITVTNNAAVATGEFVTYGIEVTDAQGHYAAVMLGSTDTGRVVRAEGTGATATVTPLTGTGAVHVRLMWDAGAKVLTAVYSADGQTYTYLASFTPGTQWPAAPTGGFNFEVFGNSNAAAAVPSATVYGDNFKVFGTAPTTYTVTATDAASATASAGFKLVVAAPAMIGTTTTGAATLTSGVAATPFPPASVSGGLAPYGYAVFPALSAGLTLDPATGTVAGTPATGTSTPLFAGSDNFDTGSTAKWEYSFRTSGATNGSLDFANGRVEFTKAAGAGNMIVGWDGDPTTPNSRTSTSRATNWVADITVTNTASSANESYSIGFQASAPGQYGSVLLNSNNGVLSIVGEGSNTTTVAVPVSATTARLRLTWDAPSAVLTTLYSVDNGASYTVLRTYHPLTEWTAGAINNGFFFEMVARSNSAGSIASGAMYLDNFAVAATAPATTNYTLSTSDRIGTFVQTGFSLTIVDPPVITSISPANAQPGSTVTISGSYLAGASAVTFGGVKASFTYNANNQTISATVPLSARTGAVQVTTAMGTSVGVNYTIPLTVSSVPFHNVVTAGQSTSLSVSLAGGAQGGTYTYQWRKNGTAIMGANAPVYYVAAMSANDVGDYDVQVSDGTTSLVVGPAALRVATPSLWTWQNRQPTASDLLAVAYGAGRYVAVGSAGTILTSNDGTTWVPQPQQPPALFFNVSFNGTQFVITGSHGTVLTSTDGLTWAQHSLGADVSISGLAYANGKWVAVGGPGGIFTSADGATWTRQVVNTGEVINAVTATPTGFMAVTSGGSILTSDSNATAWAVAQPLPGFTLLDVAYFNGVYVLAMSQHVFTSTDGTSWLAATLPTTAAGIDWNRVIVTSAGFTIAGASYNTPTTTARGYVIQSANGTNWTLSTVPAGPGLASVATSGANFVAVGFAGQIETSADNGATWTTAPSVAAGPVLGGDLFTAATGPAGTLFAGNGGAILQSTNNLSGWTRVSANTTSNLYGAVYAAGKYVIVGDDAGSGAATVLSSATGTAGSWTTVTVNGTAFLAALAFDAKTGRFIAAGAGASIFTATDPAGTWSPVAKPTTNILRAGVNGGGTTVLVGDNGTVLYSTDDATWAAATAPTAVSLQTVTYGNGRFIAGGSTGARSIIITSTDGVNWQNVPVPFTGSIRGATYADGRFLTVGGTSTVLYSNDGLNWSADTSQFSGLFRAIVRTPVGLLAGGTAGAIASMAAPTVTPGVTQQLIDTGVQTSFTPLTAAGGHSPYSFSVAPALPAGLALNAGSGSVTGAATGVAAATTYTVTVTDAVGLTASGTFTLTVKPAPTITSFTPTQATAGNTVIITGTGFSDVTLVRFHGVTATNFHIDSDTQITATVPPGADTGPVSVQTSPGGFVASSTLFTVPVLATFSDQPIDRRVAAGGTVAWFTTVSGTAPFTYSWSKDGAAITGANGLSLSLPAVSASSAGAYAVTAVNAAGSATSQSGNLVVLPSDPVLWQAFTASATEQAPARSLNAGGKVYLAWSASDRAPDFAGGHLVGGLARFSESDGTLDPSFHLDPQYYTAQHVAVQGDGKLVIAVRTGDANTVIRTSDTGVVDPTFTAPPFAYGIRFVTLQADGKVLVAATDNPYPYAPAGSVNPNSSAIVRLNADGSLDATFTPATLDGGVLFGAPVLDGSGRIYLAGSFASINGAARVNVARLNADGTLDAAFANPTGIAGFGGAQARTALVQSNGQVVFVGGFWTAARGTSGNAIQAIRFNADGTLDTTFAMPLRSDIGLGTGGVRLRAAVLNSDDSIVAVSDRVVRLTKDGAVDSSFKVHALQKESFWISAGTSGKLFVPDEMGVRNNATIVSTVANGVATFAADGTPDYTFQTGGYGRVDYPTEGAVLSDGRVWVAGNFNRFGGTVVPGIAQFSATGALTATQVASTRTMAAADVAAAGNDNVYAILTTPGDSLETATPQLVRIQPGGTFDPSFAPSLPNGYDLNSASLTAGPSGTLLLAQGTVTPQAVLAGNTGSALVRLNASGSTDAAYVPGLSSIASVTRDSSNAITMIRTGGVHVAQVLSDGRALVGATTIDGALKLERLTASGAVDTTFAPINLGTVSPSTGYTAILTDPVTNVTSQFPLTVYSAADLVRAAVQTPNGQVYVGGRLAWKGAPLGLVRFNADGSLDSTFTGAGLGNSNPVAAPYVSSLAVDAAGRVYVAGRFDRYNGVAVPGIFRLRSDGALDTAWTAGFSVLDAPQASVRLLVVGETLYAFGTVNAASGPLPAIYRSAAIPGPLVIAQQPVPATVLAGTPVSLSVTVNSTTAVTYQWYKGTTLISGATSNTLSFTNPALTDEGTYSVLATNAAGSVTSNAVTLTVNAAPAITAQPAAASAIIGTSATFAVTATGKPAVSYQWFKGTTPLTGATNASLTLTNLQYADAGNYSVRVANTAGAVTSAGAALTVTPVAPVVTSPTSISGIVGRSFLYAITTNPTPVTFSASGLPAGLTLDTGSGVISGTPTTAGIYSMTVTATNATSSDSRTVAVSIQPPPPIINSALSAAARVGAAFNYAILATSLPTTYGAVNLPTGLSVDPATGVITGTPSVYGTFDVTLSATNAGGTVTRSLVITVDPALNAPVYSGAPSLSGTAGSAFSFTPTFGSATGYALVALPDTTPSTLPAGLTFNATTGAITGTPTQTGTFPLALQATNSGGSTTVNLTLTVNPAPTAPAITSASSASGAVGSAFTFTLTSSPVATSFAATNLPTGLTLSGATISGTPSVFGTYNVSVAATNAAGVGPASILVLSIAPSPNAPTLTNSAVVTGTVGTPLSAQLTATNTPTAWEIVSGSLPAGLGFDNTTGAIAGTPNAAGQVHVWLAARNASGRGYALEMLFAIQPASTTPVITSNGSATGQVGQPFQYVISATNAPTSFAAVGLPTGLSLDATTGVISGVPVTATTQAVAITLTAAAGTDVSLPKVLLLSVAPAPATPQITSAGTAAGQVGTAFAYQVTASENATSFSALNLPPGLSLNSTSGAISGTPTQAGNFSVTLRAANAAGVGQVSTLSMSIAPALTAPAITSAAATSGKVGVALTYTATAAPTPITSFALTGTLPLGLSFNTSTGVLSGKPAESGLFTVSLTATGTGGTSLPQPVVIFINPADNVPVVTSPIYALATVGAAFHYTVTATNTNAVPVTYDAVGLPAGLALNQSTGVIEGQPTEVGQFVVTLVVTNAAGSGPSRTVTLLVQPAATAPVVTSSTSAAAQVGQPFAYQITATNTPTSFDVSGAPAWMVVNTATGTISGTPTAPGNYTVGLTAGNAAGTSNPVTVTLSIAPAANTPVITSTRTATGTVGAAFSYAITASNTPTAFVATGLPAGLTLSGAGVISGTPAASGQFEITLLARNGNGTGAPVTLILTIQPNISFVAPNL